MTTFSIKVLSDGNEKKSLSELFLNFQKMAPITANDSATVTTSERDSMSQYR